jgi:hypothetical protein
MAERRRKLGELHGNDMDLEAAVADTHSGLPTKLIAMSMATSRC